MGRWNDGKNQENPSLQTQESRVPKSDEKKLNKFWNYCISKWKTKGLIIEMTYVGHFFLCKWQCKSDIWCTSNYALYVVLFHAYVFI